MSTKILKFVYYLRQFYLSVSPYVAARGQLNIFS